MAKNISRYYLYGQAGGWGLIFVLTLWANLIFCHVPMISGMERAFIIAVPGLFVSHLLRNIILKYGWLSLSFKKAVPRLVLCIVLLSLLAQVLKTSGKGFPFSVWSFLLGSISFIPLLLCWALFYYGCYFIKKDRKTRSERAQLEFILRERRAQYEESGVSVDQLLHSLARIQTLIDENPTQSRAEITEFSKLLRRGYYS